MITKTAHQLYWDKDFIEKRIQEQKEEKWDVMTRYSHKLIPIERAKELNDSINDILNRLERQLENIKKLKVNI